MPLLSREEIDVERKILASMAVVFDCDGVIFDSNDLKTKAFRESLSAYPRHTVEDFIRYHQMYGGISRYVKFEKFFTDFIGIKPDPNTIDKLLYRFGVICRRLYRQVNITPGCCDVLSCLSKNYSLYVASGSDEHELRAVLEARDLSRYFSDVFGSPKTKDECLQEIIRRAATRRILFIGDARTDWLAARKAGLTFIFMSEYSDAKEEMLLEAEKEGFPVIETLETINGVLANG